MKLLLVGSLCDDKWIGSLIRNLCRASDIDIDFFHIVTLDKRLSEASQLCRNVYKAKRYFPSFLYKYPKISHFLSWVDVPLSLNRFLKDKCKEKVVYDIVNIHYPQNKVLCLWKHFDSISKTTIITPWGSEVLRISRMSQIIMAHYISKYDYVMSSDNPRFKNQLKDILNIQERKLLSCDFGSEMIDELCNSTVSKDEAKEHFGIRSKYAIVCGYNGGVAQNHLKIIEAITQIKEKLPPKLILVLPMTYNTSAAYLKKVEQALMRSQLDNIILKEYLSISDMICLRKCADMFIHAQSTDANSVSLAEHLLCDNVVVNAGWLRYENRETFGIPYYLFNSFDNLPDVIVEAYKGGPIVPANLKLAISAEGWNFVINKWVDIFKSVSA